MIAAFLTIFIGATFPAVGTYAWYHFTSTTSQLSELHRLYELRQNIVNITVADGIIEFPSFHTTLGLLYTYIFRNETKMIFIPILILNILMIFSCVSHGGHFFVDILGGMAVFVVAVGIEQLIFTSIKKRYLKI